MAEDWFLTSYQPRLLPPDLFCNVPAVFHALIFDSPTAHPVTFRLTVPRTPRIPPQNTSKPFP